MTNSLTPYWPSLDALRESVPAGKTPVEISRQRCADLNPALHAFLHLAEGGAATASGSGTLSGIPVAVKDNISVKNMPLTCGSRILESYRPNFDATVIERLQDAGALIIGKTNMDEFAMGSSTEYSAFGPAKNPWDQERIPGGSSGGSAVAVASGMVPVALGSDTGGSVRQPAAMCGIVGFKPSYGTVSRYGLVLYGSSLDQIGIFGNSAADVTTVFDLIRGPDQRDETLVTSLPPTPSRQAPPRWNIGLVREFAHHPSVDVSIREAIARTVDLLKSQGHTVTECSLPELDTMAIPAYYLTACAEASSNLNRFDGIRFGKRRGDMPDDADLFVKDTRTLFGPETRLRILLGTFILRTGHYDQYYSQAQAARRLISTRIAETFRQHDFLLTPTFPYPAPRFGDLVQDPLAMKLADIFTVTANLAGLPAISLPVDLARGLPTAVQFMGPRFGDQELLRFSRDLEGSLDFRRHRRPLLPDWPKAGTEGGRP